MRQLIRESRATLRRVLIVAGALLAPTLAHAAFLHGEALDTMADYIAWGVLVIAPIVGIGVFWMVHIIPEKIAEKKKHPQAGAIQALCLLSLVFGGLLWPFALLWAYTKPVLHKAAYGTDVWDEADEAKHSGKAHKEPEPAQRPVAQAERAQQRPPAAPPEGVEPVVLGQEAAQHGAPRRG